MTKQFTYHFDVITNLKCNGGEGVAKKRLKGIDTFIQTDGLDEIYKYVEGKKEEISNQTNK